MKYLFLILNILLVNSLLLGQSIPLTGYVYGAEQGHRLDEVQINVYHNDFLLSNFIETDRNGSFEIMLPESGTYRLELIRPAFERLSIVVETEDKQTMKIAIPMSRLEGYEFIGTIKQFLSNQEKLGNEIKETKIEIYNQTKGQEELNIPLNAKAGFDFNFERGNKYTLLIRKKGYFAKRFNVLVDVEGCLLCFEGLGSNYQPNILEDITKGNTQGALLVDIPLREIKINEAIRLDNIYYDYNKSNIRADARPPLDRLVQIMRATPIVIELGSHTDSRGKADYNMNLSQKRAQSAVEYIISRGIAADRITAQGYGETQLVNNCSDGVTCNEVEHQKNRRTEFKVTRLMTSSSFDDKTLKEIIETERLNKKREIEILKVD